ncbi:MAG: type IX secretion system membrane protein PorP/SprF [Psychroflexus sp.]|jgi:type IX secretion system PorP/SprF family membrane protein|nr:type IX secretion system membrane protein PorP/SprF [Psychroflexus sp.]MDR9447605.1 type IX secretion system membrane protein PorP/SprF [Psychroflexus sp.]
MRNKYLILSFFFVAFFINERTHAQQDPQYTQYMYNMNVVNPAYAGSKETLAITALFRDQWTGLQGSPRTVTLSGHSPVGNGLGIGFSAINDEIGPVEETNAYADVSYTIDFANDHHLAFGVKAGGTFQDIGLLDLDLQDNNDDAFSQNVSEAFFNVGAGFFYYTDNWYVSLSVPNFLSATYLDVNGREFGTDEQHFFASAGYVFQLSDDVKFKPSVMVKSELSSIVSYDLNANFLFFEKFEVGASYRAEDSFSGLVGFRPTNWAQVGFAYDSSVSDINEPSYEAFVTFNLFFKKKAYLSPRYF